MLRWYLSRGVSQKRASASGNAHIPEAGAKPSNAPASRTAAGTTCATLGRVGWRSEGFRSSYCRSWEAGSPPRWSGDMRTCRHRSMRATRQRSIWSLRGIPTRSQAVYSPASNWHQEPCSASMHMDGGRAKLWPALMSHIAKSKRRISLKTMLTHAKAPVRFGCFAGRFHTYTAKRSCTSR